MKNIQLSFKVSVSYCTLFILPQKGTWREARSQFYLRLSCGDFTQKPTRWTLRSGSWPKTVKYLYKNKQLPTKLTIFNVKYHY